MTAGALESWVAVAADSDFPLENIPLGIFSTRGQSERRIGAAIGDRIVDVRALAEAGLLDAAVERNALTGHTLNRLFAGGRAQVSAVRDRLVSLLLRDGDAAMRDLGEDRFLVAQRSAKMFVPFDIGDYVDFYSSIEHATNLGKIFRPDGEALMPNWRWLPIGYHGRSGTVVVDGTPIVRPRGQRKAPADAVPTFGPSTMLDIELEVGFFAGRANALGVPIPAVAAFEHIGGLVLVNDWSARDVQAWEYQPLGPFLGKSFATTISPWVVTLDALEPFRVTGPAQEPAPLPYLRVEGAANYDVTLTVELRTRAMRERDEEAVAISRTNFAAMYWNMAQQLAHATSNGALARTGDLFASGTISGTDPDSYGSLIELTWRGTRPLTLPSGEVRRFLEDGDEVTLRGWCERDGVRRIGFGTARGVVEASR